MIPRQFLRYAIVGLALNAVLYAAYWGLTRSLLRSQDAMTLTYTTGVLAGFALNRAITFRHRGGRGGALLRYIASYGFGYALNLAALWLIAGRWGVRHEIVQAGAVLTLPVVLFVLQRYWVFPAAGGARQSA